MNPQHLAKAIAQAKAAVRVSVPKRPAESAI